MPTSNQFQMTYATVQIFFCRNTATLYTNSAWFHIVCISSTFVCTKLWQQNMFKTVSEIATPFSVGGKACFLFQYSIYARNGNSLVRVFVGSKICFFQYYKIHQNMLQFQIMPPTGTVLVCWEQHHIGWRHYDACIQSL